MGCTLTKAGPGQLFALIGFVPGALGNYLNHMRRQLVPACPFNSHVTLLPPRVLEGSPSDLSNILRHHLEPIEPFEVGLGEVEVFPSTGVIYLGLKSGGDAMREIYKVLSQGEFAYNETYPYHPHLTLAQDFSLLGMGEMVQRADSLWKSWQGARSFVVDNLSFVQGVDLCTWETVSDHALNRPQCLKTA